MTGAVKLNIGICCDDERAIRHDFMLNEKIVDLLSVGYPDFIVMDAIEVGVGNEAMPTPRKLGLIIMGTNPLAVDLVGARLLGYNLDDVPYLKAAVNRGIKPASLSDVIIEGDLKSVSDLDEQAKKIMPYDDEYHLWQDVEKELKRLKSPMKVFWGPYNERTQEKCLTGCIMGLKMFLCAIEKFAGAEAFAKSKPVTFVVGKVEGEIDGGGNDVFLLGSCARAKIKNASKIIHIDRCFATAADMNIKIAGRLGMPAIILDPGIMSEFIGSIAVAGLKKIITGRYFQDIGYFMSRKLDKRI
jgi:hypothetical protein